MLGACAFDVVAGGPEGVLGTAGGNTGGNNCCREDNGGAMKSNGGRLSFGSARGGVLNNCDLDRSKDSGECSRNNDDLGATGTGGA